MTYKYSLTKKGKSICPKCGKKTFVLYVDNDVNKPIHSTVGKCDRSDNCAHHYSPKEYLADNGIEQNDRPEWKPSQPTETKEINPSFIDKDVFKKSLCLYNENRLAKFLVSTFGDKQANEAMKKYFVGTSKHWDEATVFWQIDKSGNVRAGKIMQYDDQTGKRVKKPNNRISWVHSVLKLEDYTLVQCLFGEHLINNRPIAIVESEKTAVIASILVDDFTWLACGGSENLSMQKCKVLYNKTVTLFPDLSQFNKWKEKEKELSKICTVSTSSILEEIATEEERAQGLDIADYLLKITKLPNEKIKKISSGTEEETEEEKVNIFISNDGKVFIPTPPDYKKSFTTYSSVEAYNNRTEKPYFIQSDKVDTENMKVAYIGLKSLKIMQD